MSTIKSSAENLTLNADGANNDIKFQSNGVEKASLTDGGVFTATSFAGSSTFTADSSSSGDYVRMYGSSGTGKWDIYGNGANLRFSDNESAGAVVFDRQINASSGIAIGGTGAANTLDDYEEGTFTITMSGSSSGSGTVSGTAYYTKIGRLCTVSINFGNTSLPTLSGTIAVALPFTAGNFGEHHGSDIYFYPLSKWTHGSNFSGLIPNIGASSSTHIFMVKNVSADRQSALSTSGNGNFSGASGMYARYSFTYTTT